MEFPTKNHEEGLNENISKKTGFSGWRIFGSGLEPENTGPLKEEIIGPNFQTIIFRFGLLIFGGDKLLGSWVDPTLPMNHRYPSGGPILNSHEFFSMPSIYTSLVSRLTPQGMITYPTLWGKENHRLKSEDREGICDRSLEGKFLGKYYIHLENTRFWCL